MHQLLYRIGPIPIYSYGVMIMIGFVLAVVLVLRKLAKFGIDVNTGLDFAITLLVSGVAGARLFYVLQFSEKYNMHVLNVFDVFLPDNAAKGFACYLLGGLPGGFLGLFLYRYLARAYAETRETYSEKAVKWKPGKKKKVKRELVLPSGKYAAIFRALLVGLFGIVGARAIFILASLEHYPNASSVFRTVEGGLVLYGAIIGAFLAGVVFVWLKNLSVLAFADISAPSLAIGISIGRIGCFLNGCCWGKVAETGFWSTFAMSFPKVPADEHIGGCFVSTQGSPPWDDHVRRGLIDPGAEYSLPVIPTQLMECFNSLLIFAVLTWFFWKAKNRRLGDTMFLMGILYSVQRLLIEILRGDNDLYFGLLTISQLVSIGLILLTAVLFKFTRAFIRPPLFSEWRAEAEAKARRVIEEMRAEEKQGAAENV